MRKNLPACRRALRTLLGIAVVAAPVCSVAAQNSPYSGGGQGPGSASGGSGQATSGGYGGGQNRGGGQAGYSGGAGAGSGNGPGNQGRQGGGGGGGQHGGGGQQGGAGGFSGGAGGQGGMGGYAGHEHHFHGGGEMGPGMGGWHAAGYDHGNVRWWQGRHEFAQYVGGRPGYYFAPGYGYHPIAAAYLGRAWAIGATVPPELRTYVVADPTVYGMAPAVPGFRWIYVDDGLALIDEHRGIIVKSAFHIW